MLNRFVVLPIGAALLSAGALGASLALAQDRTEDRTLVHEAVRVSEAVTTYLDRERSLDLLLAQNPTFAPLVGGHISYAEANRVLAYMEDLYPGEIGEACLMDDRGAELARVTQGVPAAAADLSRNESSNSFFAPTLALAPGQVHQEPPYWSAETHHWVISNTSPIRQSNGRQLIMHVEVGLGSFEKYLGAGSPGRHIVVLDARSGRIVLSDRGGRGSEAIPAAVGLARLARAAATFDPARPGIVEIRDRRLAMSGVDRVASNADWVLVEWSTSRPGTVRPWLIGGAGAVGIGLLVLLLLAFLRQQQAWHAAARLDHLTGMANRRALEEALGAAVHAGGDRVAVLMIDLDGFKQINDAFGHDRGDMVLREIGRRLRANTFEYDTAARLGGDEFAVVLRKLRKADNVATVAHRLREALIRPIEIDGIPRFVGASVGAAVHGEHGQTAAELLRAADAAMYQAKRSREGVRVYAAGTVAGASTSGLAAELLIAIENEDLVLVFQPEYSLETGEVVGVESLARWHRDGEPDIPPSEFIPLAEQTGLIRHLTRLTLRQALDEACVWRRAGVGTSVSVNLSAQLVTDRLLCADVSTLLRERGLVGADLVLEITETAAIGDLDVAIEVLHSLRLIGVRIELDDFGSGYASFKAVQDLPLDAIKLDRDLVNDAGTSGRHLLAATVEIGRRLGLKVVAEGIEDEATLEVVRGLRIDTAQGYHLARPMRPEALRILLGMDPLASEPASAATSAAGAGAGTGRAVDR
ncbi:bifunctional diguanylate cyclase/phosphodiesterase [Pengzhenrongella sp.]|uniref:putative bifunctional diguanylate cyclase/phosphodiesterase n=1 Tax=Pengzhenrongella sp. TaxID=2888820 RepID=UPI002F92245A